MTRLMMRLAFIVMLAVLALLGQPGHGVAQSPDKPDGAVEGGRYSFHRMGESFIRLDAQTGQVAHCGWNATGSRKDEPPAAKSPDSSVGPRLPSDAELDQAMAFMKKVWRRLIEMMADLQRDMQRKS